MTAIMFRFAASSAFAVLLSAGAFAQGWLCYGGNPQHSGGYVGTSQTASLIKWQTPLDDMRSYYGGEVLAHFAAPMVTPANTVVYGFRFTTANGQNFDNWEVIGRSGATGNQMWTLSTDYSAAVIFPNDWTSVFPITLFGTGATRGVAVAGSAGSIIAKKSADVAGSSTSTIPFYTSLADFNQNKAAYAPVKICTPLTADNSGNIYFGYEVTASVPDNLASLGSGGVAKVNVNTGVGTFQSVGNMGIDASLTQPALNAAPALTTDGKFIYVGLRGGTPTSDGGNPFLAKLSTTDLSTVKSVQLIDPSDGGNVRLINESSASPMIGPDGHVFYGVFGDQWRESHGWMVQYDANLKATDSRGIRWATGAFGWDDTAVIVPSRIVPSYKGKASYLLLTKYNNYLMGGDAGADGSNRIAVLDPSSNSITRDRQSGIPVMNEVITVLGITHYDPNNPQAVNEWCINSAAVDVNRRSAILNSEDGHMYRWNFVTNTLSETVNLAPATGEAYTETAIGPDGTIYALNNTILFAIGANNAKTVSAVQGTAPRGAVQSLWYADTETYSVQSVPASPGQSVTIEADFTLAASNPTTFNVVTNVSAIAGVTGTIWAFNFTTNAFVSLGSQTLSGTMGWFNASTSNPAQFIGPNGQARIRIQATSPNPGIFRLTADHITCGAS